MQSPQIVEDRAEINGAVSQKTSRNWAVMVPLPRLELPRSTLGATIRSLTHLQQEEEEADQGEPSTSSYTSLSSFSEDEEASSIFAQVINANISSNLPEGGAIDAHGAFIPDFSYDSSSCETPKGEKSGIPQPQIPPSPPRKRRRTSSAANPPTNTPLRHRGTSPSSFFYPPDDFELLFFPLASAIPKLPTIQDITF